MRRHTKSFSKKLQCQRFQMHAKSEEEHFDITVRK
jgi:hypothetical protein